MASYTKQFVKPYENGWENLPQETTPIRADILNDYDSALDRVETYLEDNPIITVDVVDNLTSEDTDKALSANQGKVLKDSLDVQMESLNKYEQSGFLSRNLLEASLQTTTKNGITCTNNGDGTYTLNGTSSGQTDFSICDYTDFGKATRLVGCPSSASSSTYSIRAYSESDSGTQNFYNNELGNGLALEYTSSNRKYALLIRILPNVTLSNVVLKPMIVDASLYPSATYADYTPYALGNTDLTKDVNDIDASMKMLGWTTPDSLKGKNYISNGAFYQKIYRLNISDVTIGEAGSNIFYLISSPESVLGNDSSYTPIYCSKIPTIKGGDFGSATLGIAIGHNNRKIYIKDASVSTASAFKTKYANTYIYYELETVIAKYVDGNEIAPSLKESLSQLALQTITPTLSGNFSVSDLKAYKSSNVISVACSVTVASTLTANTSLMTLPYKPVSALHFVEIRNNYSPYAILSPSGFIRGSNGLFELPNGLASGTYYINTVYICQ